MKIVKKAFQSIAKKMNFGYNGRHVVLFASSVHTHVRRARIIIHR